jgi:CheY-specific phosphatase CheX
MTHAWEKDLRRAAALTFEELGFLLPELDLNEEQKQADTGAGVYVDFVGPFNGRVVVKIGSDLMPVLAANMLGQEETPSLSQQRDAQGELANVICGNLLPMIAGSQAVFHIQAPQFFIDQDPIFTGGVTALAKVQIGLENGRADVMLFVSGQPSGTEEIRQ